MKGCLLLFIIHGRHPPGCRMSKQPAFIWLCLQVNYGSLSVELESFGILRNMTFVICSETNVICDFHLNYWKSERMVKITNLPSLFIFNMIGKLTGSVWSLFLMITSEIHHCLWHSRMFPGCHLKMRSGHDCMHPEHNCYPWEIALKKIRKKQRFYIRLHDRNTLYAKWITI